MSSPRSIEAPQPGDTPRRCSPTTARCSTLVRVKAPPCSRPSSNCSASPTATRGPITHKPAARSNVGIRLKRHLAKQPEAATINELQTQIDRFVEIYNHDRPHRARGRITPTEAFNARDRAGPGSPTAPTHFRVRTDRVDIGGKVTLRHNSKLLHIGIGRRYAGTPIRLYVADLDVRIMTTDGELLRHLTIDPTSRYRGVNREAH